MMMILSELSEAGLLGGDEGGSSCYFGRGGGSKHFLGEMNVFSLTRA